MAEQVNYSNQPGNQPGLYRHPDTGTELVVTQHPKWGGSMADGVVAQGYVYVGPAPVETKQADVQPKSAADLRAELKEAEEREGLDKPHETAKEDHKKGNK